MLWKKQRCTRISMLNLVVFWYFFDSYIILFCWISWMYMCSWQTVLEIGLQPCVKTQYNIARVAILREIIVRRFRVRRWNRGFNIIIDMTWYYYHIIYTRNAFFFSDNVSKTAVLLCLLYVSLLHYIVFYIYNIKGVQRARKG